ncbi:unnamed protein product [Gordionus sp. m RMFG-2023]
MEKDQDQSNISYYILKIYYILSALQIPKVKEDFLNNLTEVELNILEKFYITVFDMKVVKLSFSDFLNQSSEHLSSLITPKPKNFLETNFTYQQLKALVDKIDQSKFFESYLHSYKSNANGNINNTISEQKHPIAKNNNIQSNNNDDTSSSDDNDGMVVIEKPENIPTNISMGTNDNINSINNGHNTNGKPPSHFQHIQNMGTFLSQNEVIKPYVSTVTSKHLNENSSHTRTLNDLLASFQSNFNFMQDSLIDPERQSYF